MNEIEEILNSDEYFYCNKAHCQLRLEVCLERQRKNKKRPPFGDYPFPICIGCHQGERNQQTQFKKSEVAMTGSQAKNDNIKLCEECGERPSITPKHRLCGVCMGRKAKQSPKKKKASPHKNKKKSAGPTIPKAKTGRNIADPAVKIDFERYPDILDEVKALAEEELRPIDLQIIYILRNYLKEGESRS